MPEQPVEIRWSGIVRPAGMPSCVCPPEVVSYLPIEGAQLYTVLHPASGGCRARVLLAGPFPSQRIYAYVAWASWARLLSANGYEVLRFDYRGSGESAGRFEETTFGHWLDDLRMCIEYLNRDETAPLVLHGLLLGGLLAALAFKEGHGDGLLLWEPVSSAEKMLMEMLRGKLSEDMAIGARGRRKNRQAYVDALMAGDLVDVDGYAWSRPLWESAKGLALDLPEIGEDRPWHRIRFVRDKKQRSLESGPEWKLSIPPRPFWANNQYMVPDLTDLFQHSIYAIDALVRRLENG